MIKTAHLLWILPLTIILVLGASLRISKTNALKAQADKQAQEVEIFKNADPYCRADSDTDCQHAKDRLNDMGYHLAAETLGIHEDIAAFLQSSPFLADTQNRWSSNQIPSDEFKGLAQGAAAVGDGRYASLDAERNVLLSKQAHTLPKELVPIQQWL